MRRSILLLLPFAAALFGQEFRATIVGRVSDSSGAVIAGARVTATNVDTNTNTNAMRSEDAVRRAFLKGEAEEYARWLHEHLDSSYEELLSEPWILDMDGTVKPLYGQQEQAVRGYNPTKQGRPSHVYQTYFIAAIRMVLDVEVQAGNQTASIYAQPGLWAWLDRRPREQWPALVRGGIAWGTEAMMVECEKRELPYLFKIRQNDESETAHRATVRAQ